MCSLAKRFCSASNHFKTQQRLLTTLGEPLTRFGVITDIHYADRDDRKACYDPSRQRYYRHAIVQIKRAFDHWNQGNEQFVVNLGDIIDGSNGKEKHKAMRTVLDYFERSTRLPAFHVIGNHELYNFNRTQLAAYFCESFSNETILSSAIHQNIEDRFMLYYTITPDPNIKLIALDCYDVSVLGHEHCCDKFKKASSLLTKYHLHNDWNSVEKLIGLERRFWALNGALGDTQLNWLDSQLTKADQDKQKVIIFGHVGLHPDSVDSTCLLWNYDQVLNVFNRHHCVKMYMNGHAHKTGYSQMNGIHFVVLNGSIEADPDTKAFTSVSVYKECIKIDGYGVEQTRLLSIT